MTRRSLALVSLLIFTVSVLLRLPRLGGFLTPDEQRIWTTLTAEFLAALLRGDWAATATSGYPGVTTTWVGSLGLALQWLLARPADLDGAGLSGMAAALLAHPARLDMLPWLRLGVALVSAGGIVVIFWLVRRLVGDAVALLAAGLMVCDPFLLAHSRLLNTDPLLAIALVIAWLALLLAGVHHPPDAGLPAIGPRPSAHSHPLRRRFLLLSGAAFGLAALTKTPALLMAPLFVLWIFWQEGRRQQSLGAVVWAGVKDLAWLAAAAVFTALLLWPALWAAPLPTLQRVIEFTAVLSQTGHELGNFWRGQPTAAPGPLFYPAAWLWRSTPVTLTGLLLAAILMLRRDRRGAGAARALLLFALWYGLAMTFSPKKFDRYLLPAFPALDIVAAWGWVSATGWLRQRRRATTSPLPSRPAQAGSPALVVGLLLVVAAQSWSALAHLPTYLTAYNPLLGGIRTAQRVLLVGWGEGLEEAAAYLNDQPNAERVAAWYGHNVFAPFFHGASFDLLYDLPTAADLYANDIDYVVTYINQRQRGLLHPGVAAQLSAPLMESAARGVPLAEVYAWPKPFEHTVDRELAPGRRLLGWTLAPHDAASGQVQVTLAWEAAAARTAEQLPPVTAWVKDASGEVWATAQSGAETGVAAPAWLDRQALLQKLTLSLPAGLLPGEYAVEMAVTGGDGQSLGSVALAPTPISAPVPADLRTPDRRVVFGDAVELVGYNVQPTESGWQIDLLWAAQAVPPEAHYFVHLVDATERLVAQRDGPLPTWPAGALARQRVRLALPEDQRPTPRGKPEVYVGLYRPSEMERLPLKINGQEMSDRRYKLP